MARDSHGWQTRQKSSEPPCKFGFSTYLRQGPKRQKIDDAGLDVLDKFGIEIGEAQKFGLVQIHHEELISWCQVGLFRRELFVEVAHVFPVFLECIKIN